MYRTVRDRGEKGTDAVWTFLKGQEQAIIFRVRFRKRVDYFLNFCIERGYCIEARRVYCSVCDINN